MSQEGEVSIIAIIQPNPQKLNRLNELMTATIHWIRENEPETLEFSLYEEYFAEGGIKMSMFERYASQAAMVAHESSENYREFFRMVQEEELLVGPPMIVRGRGVGGMRR